MPKRKPIEKKSKLNRLQGWSKILRRGRQPIIQEKTTLPPEEWRRQQDEISLTIRRVMVSLIGFGFLSLIILGTPDYYLFSGDVGITIPIANTKISFVAFLSLGPLIMIGLLVYLHIFIDYSLQIGKVDKTEYLPFIFNMNRPIARVISWFIFYPLTPLVLFSFFWKAQPVMNVSAHFGLVFLVSCVLIGMQIRRLHRDKKKKARIFLWVVFGLFFLVTILSFTFYSSIFSPSGPFFRSLKIVGADFQNSNLQSVRFYKANLKRTNFSSASLMDANLESADLQDANLQGADFKYALLTNANFRGADLRKAMNLTIGQLANAYTLYGAKLDLDLQEQIEEKYPDLLVPHLQGEYLRNTNFQGAYLSGGHIEGADLQGADLREANLRGAFLERTILKSADLQGADLQGADLREAKLQGAYLKKCILESANLSYANLRGASLRNARLQGAILEQTNFESADLRDADLEEANLTNTNLNNANLRGANLLKTYNLTIEQLADVKTLYRAVLEPNLLYQIKESYPHLLVKLDEEEEENEISIASWNLKNFGQKKLNDPARIDIIVSVIKEYDIVAIQEVQDVSLALPAVLLNKINSTGGNYKYISSDRVGRGRKEQYLFVYDDDVIDFIPETSGYGIEPNDEFTREPFYAMFRAGNFDFYLMTIHTDPDDVAVEIPALKVAYDFLQDITPDEDDIILLGDLNAKAPGVAAGSYITMDVIATIPNIVFTIMEETNTRGGKAYDNIIFQVNYTTEYSDISGVNSFWIDFGLTEDEGFTISDHKVVWARFRIDLEDDD